MANSRIIGADLMLYTDDGNEWCIEVTPAMLEGFVAVSGFTPKSNTSYTVFSDKSIRENILPRLPKWKDASYVD